MLKKGLEDVVVGTSAICDVRGLEGRLIYQGIDIHELAGQASFEEVIGLLWSGHLPTADELSALRAQLAAARSVPGPVLLALQSWPRRAQPMDALRTAVSELGLYDPEAWDNSPEANYRKAIRLTSQIATLVAAIGRLRQGQPILNPTAGLNHAANFLYMLTGEVPDELAATAFDVALVLHADHEFNASTFAAREIVSTEADFYGAITGAMASLAGPLHGGANTKVMEMLQAIGDVRQAEAWVRDAIAQKRKIPGFGHRVYRTEDPRATHLRRLSEELGERLGQPQWFQIAQTVERVVREVKGLNANVDFYSAPTYFVMGISPDMFTPIFAVSRIAGWAAHVMEQFADNRLIRPRAEYVGPVDRHFVPIDQRGVALPRVA